MSWIGAGIGAFLGASRGGGLIGGLIGAILGDWVETKAREAVGKKPAAGKGKTQRRGQFADGNELATLSALAAMLAKMAKADGRITSDEVRYCERVFNRVGLRGRKREYCIRVFRMAKDDPHSIFDYAYSYVLVQRDKHMREIVYETLWDLACSDGTLSSVEQDILWRIVDDLQIDPSHYEWQCRRRGIAGGSERSGSSPSETQQDPYAVIGCRRTDSDEVVRNAYREKAKQLHPDVLRSHGLSEELISKANAQMSRINAAWAEIRKERGL